MINTAISKVEDMENCLLRDNIRVVDIPEKTEGNDPIEFAEHWLMDILGKDYFSPLFAVEHAHRVSTPSQARKYSTPFLICL